MTDTTPANREGYCTDCEAYTVVGQDGRGSCGHGRVITLRSAMSALKAETARADRAEALLAAHDAWAAGVPSQPPATGRDKTTLAELTGGKDA